ncbi:Uncharacterized conserved protein YdeI, YjbR/CyaY-like superfamily, DUF1801 family [Chryseobacterium culicis]|uniref:Uncharacterized conserved protein YdeI, YjbR/CyaY-like superfamily, DUF1801 family n=2 Tax=Chryseobacterium culicis TaxID=680127 RepID=A0A1H6HBA0_CHRCI|nr:Uncharacterized conserved protein YdeI, YjbR/CyaY-like superfamily, DUF1801 family [Chryseobacterium culicis]
MNNSPPETHQTLNHKNMNPKVNFFFNEAKQWKKEFEKLRTIALSTELVEDLKWGCPCYTYEGKNIFLIHGFKEYCALLFFKGALMKDPDHILIQQSKNVQAARQIRFTDVKQINDVEQVLRAYMFEAVEIEESGAKVEMKKTKEFEMAEEFQNKLDENPALQKAFKALTPGRQRAYLLHFSSAKQSKTREARIEKCIPQIMEGIGLKD